MWTAAEICRYWSHSEVELYYSKYSISLLQIIHVHTLPLSTEVSYSLTLQINEKETFVSWRGKITYLAYGNFTY